MCHVQVNVCQKRSERIVHFMSGEFLTCSVYKIPTAKNKKEKDGMVICENKSKKKENKVTNLLVYDYIIFP